MFSLWRKNMQLPFYWKFSRCRKLLKGLDFTSSGLASFRRAESTTCFGIIFTVGHTLIDGFASVGTFGKFSGHARKLTISFGNFFRRSIWFTEPIEFAEVPKCFLETRFNFFPY